MGVRYLGSPKSLVGKGCLPGILLCVLWYGCNVVVCVLVFFYVGVGNVSVMSWSRGLYSPVFCSGMRCPTWW
jgi:hypothetical protein